MATVCCSTIASKEVTSGGGNMFNVNHCPLSTTGMVGVRFSLDVRA